jgi:hypothetical protein
MNDWLTRTRPDARLSSTLAPVSRDSRRQVVRRGVTICLVGSMLLVGHGSFAEVPAESSPEEVAFFEARIRPVLVERCAECHGQEAAQAGELKGGLRVDTRQGLRIGGDSGPAIIPGKPDESLLLGALRHESYEMPPDGKLPEQVIADFARWIAHGAADPRDAGATLASRAVDLAQGSRHWAYQPLTGMSSGGSSSGTEPAAGRQGRSAETASTVTGDTPIDRFVEREQLHRGLKPLPEADRVTLLRRVTFDLTGLPPTAAEAEAFLNDRSPEAYERVVDRLLGSPHFGERWGRHWLDVVRFAESVTLRGLVQHEAWRYREYVINSFNADVPFDQFVREQIAGDLLPSASWADRSRQLIATTFLTLANANLEEQDKTHLRMDVVDEQLGVIGSAMLGQTLGCARCHDHKFDPIPTTDYYALAGILWNTRVLEHANVSRWIERGLPLPPDEEAIVRERESRMVLLRQQLAALNQVTGSAGASKEPVAVSQLPGIVLDDDEAILAGRWRESRSVRPFVGRGYRHDEHAVGSLRQATFRTLLTTAGEYEVRLGYTPGTNRSSAVRVVVRDAAGEHEVTVNQQEPPPQDGLFVALGRYEFSTDDAAEVVVSNAGADGHVVVDAVQFLPVDQLADGGTDRNRAARQQAAAEEESLTARARKSHMATLEQELKQLQSSEPKRPMYMAVEEESAIEDLQVHIRGNVHQLGPRVPRGFLQVLPAGQSLKVPAGESGRRQLAEWLTAPDNPLTPRVFANRAWLWLLGDGIVRTPDNFGTTGEAPTHPELLDYLATRFLAEGWSVKGLVREIVMSRTYRRSSRATPALVRLDPENRWLARGGRRRLEAECLLDAILTASGEIDHQIGGKTVPEGLSADYGFTHDSRRRAVYWPLFRNAVPEVLQVFDAADPSLVTGRRTVSSVAPQALLLLNSPWVLDQCDRAAMRLLAEPCASEEARLDQLFWRTLGRDPLPEERQAALEFLGEPDMSPQTHRRRWAQLVQSLWCSLDFRYLH